MSYDLYLFLEVADGDQLNTARSKLNVESDVINPGPLNPDSEAQKQTLMTALIVENPQLQPFEFEYPQIARMKGITESEARIEFRHIELSGPDNGNGIQIVLFDDNVTVTIPYWHQPPAAVKVFEEVWRYLHVMMRTSRFFVYDPQLDRVLNVVVDQPAVLKKYGGTVAKIPQIVAQAKANRRAWWKFW